MTRNMTTEHFNPAALIPITQCITAGSGAPPKGIERRCPLSKLYDLRPSQMKQLHCEIMLFQQTHGFKCVTTWVDHSTREFCLRFHNGGTE